VTEIVFYDNKILAKPTWRRESRRFLPQTCHEIDRFRAFYVTMRFLVGENDDVIANYGFYNQLFASGDEKRPATPKTMRFWKFPFLDDDAFVTKVRTVARFCTTSGSFLSSCGSPSTKKTSRALSFELEAQYWPSSPVTAANPPSSKRGGHLEAQGRRYH
jgi:hypothetical protein